MRYQQVVFVCLCVAFGGSVPSTLAQVVATLDEASFFVLHGTGVQMLGLQIESESGGLMPIPDSVPNRRAPFQFLLKNTNDTISYGNLGTFFTLDGSVKLEARWNSNWTTHDVEMTWGGANGTEAVTLSDNFYEFAGPCEQCPPPPAPQVPRVTLNDENFVVLSARGYELTEATFRSPSNSLVPSASPAPFVELATNTPREVTFASPGAPVVIDGSVTLGVGWNDHIYERDISYDFQPLEGERTKTTVLSNQHYDLPAFPRLGVWVNDDDQFVISGEGLPITKLTLSSNGSLIPGQDPAPFGSFQESTSSRVTMSVPTGALTLDGEVTLDTKWNWHDQAKRVSVSYDLLGDLRGRQFTLPRTSFPDVPIAGLEPLLITLDEQNNFVITGTGQQVNGIEFRSPSGALTTSEKATAPFPHLLANTSETVTLGVLGNVVVDGSHVMDFGISDPSLLDEISITVGYGEQVVLVPPNEICNRCDLPQVSMSPDRGFVLTDFPDPIKELRFFSPGGGLTSFDPPEGVSIATSTPRELVVTSDDGFDAAAMRGLTMAWGAQQDFGVYVSMSLADGRHFGPFVVGTSLELVPEPTSWWPWLSLLLPLLPRRRRQKRGQVSLSVPK